MIKYGILPVVSAINQISRDIHAVQLGVRLLSSAEIFLPHILVGQQNPIEDYNIAHHTLCTNKKGQRCKSSGRVEPWQYFVKKFRLSQKPLPLTEIMVLVSRSVGNYGCIKHFATATTLPSLVCADIIKILFGIHSPLALWTLHVASS